MLVEKIIAQQLAGVCGLENVEICRGAKLVGQSTFVHQIDVSYKFRAWKTEFLVLVECKQYQRRVGVDDLLEFRSRIDDLKANKGVFVTSVGYQSGAVEFAAANRIALLIIRGTRCSVILEHRSSHSVDRLLTRLMGAFSGPGTHAKQGASRSTDFPGVDVALDGVKLTIGLEHLQLDVPAAPICRFEQSEAICHFEDVVFRYVKCDHLLRFLVLQELLDRQKVKSSEVPRLGPSDVPDIEGQSSQKR